TRRDHGKIVFIDLRDRSGKVQLVGEKKLLKELRSEDVVSITGKVNKRPDSMVNTELETGTVEIEVTSVEILSKSQELPIPIHTDGHNISEEMRLKYRYLDLRRPRMQRNIRLRSEFVDRVRQFLIKKDFVEIETPLLTKSTPEGSRDFLVPSRMRPGKFYALPQSPQQYKQLLMASGFERYFQLPRCLRDEDLRADRGFEHTQIDIEMSFVTREDVMKLDEEMMITVAEAMGYTIKQKPFPVITYDEAMKKYGADKFDMRTEQEKKDGILAYAWVVDFPFFEKTDDGGWTFSHNPFSNPLPDHKEWLLQKKNIGKIVTQQYDLVCNGYEVGGGSIRAHEPEVLKTVFEIMGHKHEDIEKQFGHMLEAFSYGIPPHGGLAHGVERLIMTITGEPYLREVVAFPMTSGGQTSVMDAPSEITQDQLDDVGLSLQLNDGGDVFGRIVRELEKLNIQYKAFKHESVITSKDAAKIRGTNLEEGAKALVLYADDKPLMVAVSGVTKIDFKAFKRLYEIKDLRMATPDEVQSVTSVPIGAVPPFGHIFGIPLYMDKQLSVCKNVVFNAGLHTKSISMNEKDYEKMSSPIIGEFSKAA
ncbi:amino acid--tRNA ligase-related protein, partial [Patescibacteria group bacterium]